MLEISPLLSVVLAILTLAMGLAFVRLLRGPSLPDRVVALDLMAILAVGYIAVYDVATNQVLFLDIALALALIAFLGTVAFARFIEKRGVMRGDELAASELTASQRARGSDARWGGQKIENETNSG